MVQRLYQMLIKEFIQVVRDKRMRFILVVPPMVQMLVFGYAATFEVHNVPMAVLDLDHSQESRELVSRFTSSPYFAVRGHLADERQLRQWIETEQAVLVLHIHPGFARKLRKGQTAPLQVVVDATNSNTALIALGYVNQIAQRFAADYQSDRMEHIAPQLSGRAPQITLERRPWYNHDLKSQWFFVPGVVATLILIMVGVLTAFAIVREREIGTLEQIMVTPIRRTEFILGKTAPFFLIGLMDTALIALMGTLWFRIPFRGDFTVLLLGAVLYIFCILAVGLFISTISKTQQQAMVSAFFFNMPAIIFSGFGFPIRNMPEWLQWLTYLDPLRYFLIVIRSVYLKGTGLDVLWPQMAAMAVLAVGLLTISVLRFRKSLD
ncbi:MAG TPA: ABC transporter permease [Candidatus Xenobia bacterium]|nr:ABC transporter permease [Candidatus Xenobia bacterium]